MLKKIICLGMVAVAFFSACDGSSDTMSGPDELESSSSAFSSSSSFFQQQTNPVVPPNGSSSSSSLNASSVSYGTLVDSRDGQVYKTVVIGTQTWMAEDLNYHNSRFSSKDSLVGSYTWAEAVDSAGLFSLGALNCESAGVDERCAMPDNVRGICPEGWHIPSRKEWNELQSLLSRGRYDGTKEASIEGELLKTFQSTCNLYGFSLRGLFWLPHSYFVFHKTRFVGGNEYFCVNENEAVFSYESLYGFYDPGHGKIRCLQDDTLTQIAKSSSSLAEFSSSESLQSSSSKVSSSSSRNRSSSSSKVAEPAEGTLTDSRDGQTYKIINIGTQTWMAQNLNYKTENSYCYENDASNCTRYGRLYVWDTATTVCPNGWLLPSKAEWETLFSAVGGLSTVLEVLKSTTGWDNNANGTDAFSFAAYPAGIYAGKNRFDFLGKYAFFWSSTEDGGDSAYLLSMGAGMAQFTSIFGKEVGTSVRCVKDSE